MKVPVFDLKRAAARIEPELYRRWQGLLQKTAFVGGDEVNEFEKSFAEYVEVDGCVGVGNGTEALVLALRALNLSPGDEVIVPSFTFIATAAAIELAGGRPVFADVLSSTLNLDPDSVAERIGPRTAGILVVHLFGRPADMKEMSRLCREHRLWLLEDAAQAHGARWQGRRVGGIGQLATWSFYPAKNLGCFGDGGAVTANDSKLLERVRGLANHGRVGHYHHAEVGTNSRLDALQAAVLNCRLPLLEADNARRREIATRYASSFDGVGDLAILKDDSEDESVYHQFTLRTGSRDALQEHLSGLGIGSGIHYPMALHQQPAFADVGTGEGGLPEAEAAAREVLCLPMFPELTDEEVNLVCEAVKSFYL